MTPADIEKLPYRPCVGLVIMNAAGEVFAGQRIDNPGDAWQMPQGGVDEGETPLQAALRELGEETGINEGSVEVLAETSDWIPYELPRDLVPKLWNGRFRGQAQKWFLLKFTGDNAEINIVQDHQEFSRWAWIKPGDLIDKIVPFKKHTYTQVFADFESKMG